MNLNPLEPITTKSADGQTHTFWCSVDGSPDGEWQVAVFKLDRIEGDFWYGHFVPHGRDQLRCQSVNNQGEVWALRKGISEAVFALVHQRSGKAIVSSRQDVPGTTEYRTIHATRMWERFAWKGLARYDAATARYIMPAEASPES